MNVLTEMFTSDDHPITVELFAPEGARHPGILLLHGANGIATTHGPHRRLATLLAESGYAVFFVHYFDRTQTAWADRDTIREHFLLWRKTIVDAGRFAAGHRTVNGAPLGLLGFSLGATLGLTVAGRLRAIRAITEFSGEVPDAAFAYMKAFPPALIIHGAKDPVIPAAQASKLEHWLKERGVPCELKIYPDEKHIFREPAASDAVKQIVAFFDKYLRVPPARQPSEGPEHQNAI